MSKQQSEPESGAGPNADRPDRGDRGDRPTDHPAGRRLPGEGQPPPKTESSTKIEFLKDRLGTILGFVLILIAIAVYAGWELTIPRFWYVYGLSFAFLLPGGWMVASYASSWLADPQPDWVVDLDAREIDGAIVRFPADTLRDLEVTTGEMCQLAPNLYTARNVDLEAGTAEGTWRGTLSDRDLLVALEAVYECRGRLEDQAQRGFALEKQFYSILRSSTRDTVLSVVRTFEEGSLPDGADSLHDHIESALDHHGLDTQIKTGADDFDLEPSLTEYDADDSGVRGGAAPRSNGVGTDE